MLRSAMYASEASPAPPFEYLVCPFGYRKISRRFHRRFTICTQANITSEHVHFGSAYLANKIVTEFPGEINFRLLPCFITHLTVVRCFVRLVSTRFTGRILQGVLELPYITHPLTLWTEQLRARLPKRDYLFAYAAIGLVAYAIPAELPRILVSTSLVTFVARHAR